LKWLWKVWWDAVSRQIRESIMPSKSEGRKALDQFLKAAKKAPKETPEQKADRERRRAAYDAMQQAKYGASNAAFMAAYRAAHPVPEIATGSPYQAAKEAWTNPENWKGAVDHWTAAK
jgi:hypothetical protein